MRLPRGSSLFERLKSGVAGDRTGTAQGLILAAVIGELLNPRRRSLGRGTALVLTSVAAAFRLSRFPQNHASAWLALPCLISLLGTVDTIRCMQQRWNLYHAGVVLLIYMDLMADFMILFLFLYPYALWLSTSR